MDTEQDQKSADIEKLKEIPKLARCYAENRTVPLIIFSIVYLVLLAMVFFAVCCFLKGEILLGSIMMVLYVAGLIYFLITSNRNAPRYYAETGIPESQGLKQIGKFLPIPILLLCAIGIIMEYRGVFPTHLRVPISAVGICPLLIFANWRWAKGSFIGYLWAGLYGAWAIAILFKVPILTFSGTHAGDEMALAVPVTGLITGLIVYIYSRHALKKLKEAAYFKERDN